MAIMIKAIYDGKVFLPIEPIQLEPNTRVRLSIQANQGMAYSFLSAAQSLDLDGPPDWSAKLDGCYYSLQAVPPKVEEPE